MVLSQAFEFSKNRTVEFIGVAGAVLWAGILRMTWPGVSPFAYDEAELSRLALELARTGRIPVTGMISSAGVPNLPVSVWIFALPYAISTNPEAAVLFVALLNILGVIGVWWVARRAGNGWAGVAAAWLLAGSPYGVFYSRGIWAQDLLVPLSVLWAVTGLISLEKRRGKWLFFHGFVSALAPQVHYAGFVLPVLSVFVGIFHRFRWEWLPFFIGALASALTLVPLVLRVLSGSFRLGFGSGHLHFGFDGVKLAATLLSGYGWDWLFIGNKWHLGDGAAPRVIGDVLLGLAGVGLLLLILRLRGRERRPSSELLLIWAVGAPALWVAHFLPSRLHYQLISLPALFAVSGQAVAFLPKRPLRAALLGLVILFSLIQGGLFARGIAIAGSKVTHGGISTPLKYHLNAVGEAKDGNPVIGVVPDTDLRTGGDAAIFDVLLWGYPHRLVNGTYSMVWPSAAANLLFVGPWMPAWVENEGDLSRNGRVEFIRRREGAVYPYVLVRLEGGTRPEGFNRVRGKALSNGLTLEGWRAHPLGTWMRFVTLWRVGKVGKRADYHQFNHLYVAGADKPVAGQDTPTSSDAWEEGDYLITWADFPSPPGGRMKMAVGMYEYPSMKRVPWLGVANPDSPVFLGPFELK